MSKGSKLKIGQAVFVPEKTNCWWTGSAVVEDLFLGSDSKTVLVRMTSGNSAGQTGGIDWDLLEVNQPMQILKIKRSNQKTGLKVYGEVIGESGNSYNFAYIRRPNFRGWICSCENFFFTMFKKNRNCKHIKFVRAQVGRYGTQVPKVS